MPVPTGIPQPQKEIMPSGAVFYPIGTHTISTTDCRVYMIFCGNQQGDAVLEIRDRQSTPIKFLTNVALPGSPWTFRFPEGIPFTNGIVIAITGTTGGYPIHIAGYKK